MHAGADRRWRPSPQPSPGADFWTHLTPRASLETHLQLFLGVGARHASPAADRLHAPDAGEACLATKRDAISLPTYFRGQLRINFLNFLNLCVRRTWQARTRNARGGCVPAVERLRAGPASAVELEKRAPLHDAAKQRRVVWKFLRGQGRLFQKEPLIIMPTVLRTSNSRPGGRGSQEKSPLPLWGLGKGGANEAISLVGKRIGIGTQPMDWFHRQAARIFATGGVR